MKDYSHHKQENGGGVCFEVVVQYILGRYIEQIFSKMSIKFCPKLLGSEKEFFKKENV